MKKIHDIEIEKTFYRREKDAFGNVYRDPYKKTVKREVELVSTGHRFGYFLIDLAIVFGVQLGITFCLWQLMAGVPDAGEIIQFVSFMFFLGYYFLFEHFMQQTPGKMLLGYVVINDYAHAPTMGETAIRTVCRMIPFEGFSCLGDNGGWHDRFSQTWVVKKSERDNLQRHLGGIGSTDGDLLDQ